MGIKENFSQAVKELTGMGKDKPVERENTVDKLKKAVNDGSDVREISLDAIPDLDETEFVSARSVSNSANNENNTASASMSNASKSAKSKADAFISGEPVPVSLFGTGQSNNNATAATANVHPIPKEEPQQSATNPLYPDPPQPPQNPLTQWGSANRNAFPNHDNNPNSFSGLSSRSSSSASKEDSELTIISRNTVIDGNVRSFADMSIDGDIKGDVETTKNIDLNGKIIGDVTCNNAMMHTSQVQGNIRMKGSVNMKRDTLLIGDLMSTYAEVNGKVKGNLDVVGKAELRGDAVVFGDISASTITVEDGAIIQGYVSTTFLNKEESRNLFPDTVVIGDAETSRA